MEEIPALVEQLEAQNPQEELLQITAMVIGLTGSGKSSTINSLLGYDAVSADAFDGTKTVSPPPFCAAISEILQIRRGTQS